MDEGSGLKAGAFACGDEEREINVRRDVLLADGIEEVAAGAMFGIGAESAARAMWLKKIVLQEAVVDSEEPACGEGVCGAHPPGDRFGRNFDGELIWQNREQFLREAGEETLGVGILFVVGERLPLEITAEVGDAPFVPVSASSVPAKDMHGHGVEQFVGKTNAAVFGEL